LSATVLQIERWRTGGQRENTQKLIRLRPALTYPGVVLPVMQGIRFPVTCSESCVTEALYLFGRIPLGTITTSDGIQAAKEAAQVGQTNNCFMGPDLPPSTCSTGEL